MVQHPFLSLIEEIEFHYDVITPTVMVDSLLQHFLKLTYFLTNLLLHN